MDRGHYRAFGRVGARGRNTRHSVSFGEESAVRGIDVASFVHPMLLPLRFWSVLLYHDRATPDLAPPIMILASLVLLSIIVVVSVSLTEVIGVREGTAA